MPNTVAYRGYQSTNIPNTNAVPSPNIWYDCPFGQIRNGDVNGTAIWDNFDESQGFAALPTTEGIWGRYKLFSSATATVAQVADSTATASTGSASSMKLTPQATNNLSVSMATPSLPFRIANNQLASSPTTVGKFWFECRVALGDITATTGGTAVIGVASQRTLIVGDPLTTSDAMISTLDFVGFQRPVTAVTWDATYQATGVAPVIVKAGVSAVAAAAYVKLGMVYDPTTNILTYYVSGVPASTRKYLAYTGTNTSGSLATTGTDFPDGVQMGLILAVMQGSTAAQTLTIDWWRAAQLYTS